MTPTISASFGYPRFSLSRSPPLRYSWPPILVNAPDGLFIFINKFAGFIAIPIACLVILGLFANSLRIPPRAAQFVIIFHIATYYTLVWGLESFGYRNPHSLDACIHNTIPSRIGNNFGPS